MRALDRKVLRDLRLLWSQALTIALVVASGIGGFIAMLSAVAALENTRDAFYADNHFADLFAGVRRAPGPLAQRLAELPGVVDVQVTVEAQARVSVPGSADPATGRLIGLDERHPPRLDVPLLRSGRWPAARARGGTEMEAAVSESFAQAHALQPGDFVLALVNGKQRRLVVTGTALSPEYVFAGMQGAPDVRTFGVFWVPREELAAALDMQGAFNRVAFKLAPGASQADVADAARRVLERFGGTPPSGREEQPSHVMLDNEIREQTVIGTVLPAIFLAVAGFLVHVVTARLVATQREQVAALKALGYGNRSIAAHYVKLVLPMLAGGWLLGLLLGRLLAGGLLHLYGEVFRFPAWDYALPPALVLVSLAVVAATGLLGILSAVAATVRLSPAEAMLPPAPGRYRPALLERVPRLRLPPALRMILRNLERRPLRTAVTIGGIAAATAIVILGSFFRDAIDAIVDTQFNLALRGDLVVWTLEPLDAGARRELARVPGVLQVEAGRRVPVRFVHGQYSHSGFVDGRDPSPLLDRIVDADRHVVPPGAAGLLMTDRLAQKLHLAPGQRVRLEVRDGRRQVIELALEGTVRDMMGMNAFMAREPLDAALADGDLANHFALRTGPATLPRVLQATQAMPAIAGAFSKATMLRNMLEVSARNMRIISSILSAFAAVIAVGVVYNNASIALAERQWELASLRVLGFTRGEISYILLGELGLLTLVALPLGLYAGRALCWFIAHNLQNDLYRIPLILQPNTYAFAVTVVVAAAVVSGLLVRRRLDRLDLIGVLKTKE